MRSVLRALGVLAAAAACAVVFGVGVPLGWVWVASQLQPTIGQGTSDLAALVVIVGPLASYIALVVIAGRFSAARKGASGPARMAWNRSRDEAHPDRETTTLDQVILLAIFFVAVGFEVWFFFFAHRRVWGS